MEKLSFLAHTPLFRGISEADVASMLSCLGGVERDFQRDEVIFRAGDPVRQMGILLMGAVNVVRGDVWGNLHIIDHVGPGQSFAETYACIPGEILMVDVVAAEDAHAVFLDVQRTLEPCPSACSCHARLLRNLLTVMASKNMTLTRKMTHITPKSIRERLLSYLSYQALEQGCYSFEIPFNRQQLADYLSVERSALSNELSKMRRDGLIEYKKSRFTLLCEENPPA
ncbi:MAG: Crp/Fnr family transcriptional regulator [Clostridiales bacterium]|jgi:CRP-like cAMP-binding protein|nr:Crp/Fnr family transcriptional regulator [Clostridiales bacterium]OPZ69402.1 MAG: transcriptional regulator FixK [Firmicutes bacterium ADurb.Bin467]